MGHLDFEKQTPDGSWVHVQLPIVDMVCHIPPGVYRPSKTILPAGVGIQGAFNESLTLSTSIGYFLERHSRKPKRHKEVFWARRWK